MERRYFRLPKGCEDYDGRLHAALGIVADSDATTLLSYEGQTLWNHYANCVDRLEHENDWDFELLDEGFGRETIREMNNRLKK